MSYQHLTSDQRSQIYALKSNGHTLSSIALHIAKSVSCISREISRNSGDRGYRPIQANEKAMNRRTAASSKNNVISAKVLKLACSKIQEDWSPVQVSGFLRNSGFQISYETLYKHIWSEKRAGGKLYTHLRHRGKKYNHRSSGKSGRGVIPNRIDISNRPAIVEEKKRFGDWEGDTIIGANHKGAILSLVDRKSKFTILENLSSKSSDEVIKAFKRIKKRYPALIFKTITFDNGKEFSGHQKISKVMRVKCYFAAPYSSWQRGLNEHTNGLTRQYVPKKSDFTKLTRKETRMIENKLNNRPRLVLNFMKPREVIQGYRVPSKVALQP